MPAASAAMTEGKLARWLVKEGQSFAAGDVIAEIETDKAMVEFEAPMTGALVRILVQDGAEAVRVGEPIAIVEGGAESAAELGTEASPARDRPATPVERPSAPQASADAAAEPIGPTRGAGDRIFVSPVARAIASQRGVDLRAVKGTGPHGRIVKADVESHLQAAPADALAEPMTPVTASPSAPSWRPMPWQAHRATPHSAMRRSIARRLVESKQAVPHFYLVVSIELDRLLDARARLNAGPAASNKLSINDFFIKAAALALRQVPEANAMWTDDAALQFDDVDISVAVATDGGLIAPVVRGADKKGLESISLEMKELASRARAGRLKPEEFQGGGFSISNLGMYAVEQFAAIINPPQSCILALGAAEKRAVVRDDAVVARTMLTATLSVDHRSVDGAVGARLLSAIKALIEEPVRMIL
jgi:pyruvate dehydrogenase E2 component (dihydrolipoamide acetyltransferase)